MQSIQVTAAAASDVLYVVCAIPNFCSSGEVLRAMRSAKVSAGYSGNVSISTYYEQYGLFTMPSGSTSSPVAGVASYVKNASGYGSSVDLAATSTLGVGIGNWQGFSLPGVVAQINGFKLSPPAFCFVGLRITVFIGILGLKFLSVTSQTKLGE